MAFARKLNSLIALTTVLLCLTAAAQTDPCAPIQWRGETPWKSPVSTNITLINLDDFITEVFSNSITIRTAEAAVASAQREVSLQRSTYWPTLTAETSWNQTLDGRTHRESPDNYAASLNATWLLFDGFQRELSVLKSKYDRNAAQYAEQEVRRGLHQVISTVWFATYLAQERMDASQDDIFFNKDMLESVVERYEAGVARRSDVLNFKVKLMEDVNTYFTQRLLFDSNITILERLRQTHGTLSIDTHRLVDPYPYAMDFLDLDIDEQIKFAESARGDIQGQKEQILASQADVNISRGTRLPSVSFSGDYSVGQESSYTFEVPDEATTSIGITLSWDLFSGFSSHHEIMQKNISLLLAEMELESLELDLREELTRLFKSYNHALQIYYNSILRKEAAFEDRELVTLLYESDLVAVTRLNEVQKDSVHAIEQNIISRVLVAEAWESILIASGRMRHEALAAYSTLQDDIERDNKDLFHTPPPQKETE